MGFRKCNLNNYYELYIGLESLQSLCKIVQKMLSKRSSKETRVSRENPHGGLLCCLIRHGHLQVPFKKETENSLATKVYKKCRYERLCILLLH